jgi:AcrR family transcriptional regulator
MSTSTARRPSARERLLDAADELFYEEGIHIVGIDRVIEKAGVAKASLYSTFGSKDELVRAYLNRKYEQRRTRITEWLTRYSTPRGRLLGVFDALGDSIAQPGYHGCAFANASAESSPGSVAEQVTQEYRAWTRNLFTELARDAGAADPATLAAQLHLLYDGVNWAARIDHDLDAARRAQAAAEVLLDAATG